MSQEFDKFDAVMQKILSVSHDELKKREKEWKRKRARKKRTKTSPASRASSGKG
ncbi:MAG TPA: hypothetical protein VFQ43_02615 [Nitrososphaera sp.]|nr:hypothetical protein [Nitrososphaera sp.]